MRSGQGGEETTVDHLFAACIARSLPQIKDATAQLRQNYRFIGKCRLGIWSRAGSLSSICIPGESLWTQTSKTSFSTRN